MSQRAPIDPFPCVRIAVPRRALVVAVLATAAGSSGCGGDDEPSPTEPDPVSSVDVVSPIEDVMAVGRSVTLEAVVRDGSGEVVEGSSFEWTSSDETVASVDVSGLVEGLEAGTTTFTAEAEDGSSGSLDMEVVAADLTTLSALLDDPFTDRLVSNLTEAPREAAEAALADCADALAAGHIIDLSTCLEAVRDPSATDPTDRALIAVMSVIAQRADLLLNR